MNRNQMLDQWMTRNNITPLQLEKMTNIQAQAIRGILRGDYPITDRRWVIIEKTIKDHSVKPQIITKVPQYILQSLEKFDNTIVMKKKVKKREQELIDELKKHGYNCRMYSTGDDHYVIENKERFPRTPELLKGKVIID